MAKRTKSGQKAARKSQRRRLLNRKSKQALKDVLKKAAAVTGKAEAIKLLPDAQSVIDKSARKRIIHRKTANRIKSRLAREAAAAK